MLIDYRNGNKQMNVYVIKAIGGKYRDCSLMSAMHMILSDMRLGQSIDIEKVVSVDGREEQTQAVRMVINKIKKEDGISVVTRFNKTTGVLKIIRVNGLL